MLKDSPEEVIIAHNGIKFDFPMLCSECIRNDLCLSSLGKWRFVDTLHVFRSIDPDVYGGCAKLQCLRHTLASKDTLQAHRALDDCIALKSVLSTAAELLGLSVFDLLRPFISELDVDSTCNNLSVLVGVWARGRKCLLKNLTHSSA